MRVQFEVPENIAQMMEILRQSPAFMHASPRSIFIVLVAQAHAALTQTSGHVPNGVVMPSTHLTPAKQRKVEEDEARQKRTDRRREWAAMSPSKRREVWSEYYEDFGSPPQSDGSHIDADGELVPDWCIGLMEQTLEQVMGVSFETD